MMLPLLTLVPGSPGTTGGASPISSSKLTVFFSFSGTSAGTGPSGVLTSQKASSTTASPPPTRGRPSFQKAS